MAFGIGGASNALRNGDVLPIDELPMMIPSMERNLGFPIGGTFRYGRAVPISDRPKFTVILNGDGVVSEFGLVSVNAAAIGTLVSVINPVCANDPLVATAISSDEGVTD